MVGQLSLDPNHQKTHYSIDTRERKKRKCGLSGVGFWAQPANIGKTPFVPLLQESEDHVRQRFMLYEKVWQHQRAAIEDILNSANISLFSNLLKYIQDPLSAKLDIAFLSLSSNTANNFRLLEEFAQFLAQDLSRRNAVRLVRLNSKVCFNIKTAIREAISQITQEPSSHSKRKNSDYDDDSDNEEKIAGENGKADDDVESEKEEMDDEESSEVSGGRISYDFEIVHEWLETYLRKHKSIEDLRIIVVLDDSDGFSNEILNQLIQLFCVYSKRCPIKLIMGLSSRNVSDWVNSNISSKLKTMIQGVRLESKDNKDIGFQVINDTLLQNEITPENPLLLDARLSSIILNRFENSNNSIDSLITELKLSYMIHFYQSPLPSLIDPTFTPDTFHYDSLRKLPSFKAHIEYLINKFEAEKGENNKHDILGLLGDNTMLQRLFNDAKDRIQKYQNAVMNAVSIIHFLCKGRKEKFQIYKLVTNNQLVNSAFLSDLLKEIKSYSDEEVTEFKDFVFSRYIKEAIGNCADESVIRFRQQVRSVTGIELVKEITDYLHKNEHLNMRISDTLFNEVLLINGGLSELDDLKPQVWIEENYENLMINLIRPNNREALETALNVPQKYLRNTLILERIGKSGKTGRVAGPLLCKLYSVFKDAPVNINLYDFFVAFKSSLSKPQVMAEIKEQITSCSKDVQQIYDKLTDSTERGDQMWNKLVYSWFVQGCSELTSMGFMREKQKGNYVEKMVWKNL